MPRPKQKFFIEPSTFGLLAGLGLIWLIAQSQNAGSIIALIAAGPILFVIVRSRRRASARNALLHRVAEALEQHISALIRRRAQLVRLDAYGKPQREKWLDEINHFISQHIQPRLTPMERDALERSRDSVVETIDARVETAMRDQPAFQTYSDDMTPAEFETFCAEQLRLAGWNARVTLQSRDQGVDVVAEKDGRRVVLQCKLYARPVGNKAVQEAAAARAHEQADFGLVVSNNRYTEAAEELAATNGILLLHYRDLSSLDDLLNRIPAR
jgi:restriction system protein